MGSARDRSALMMAGEFGIPVYSIEYSLAPEAKYPVTLNQCLAVYKALVTERDPRRIIGVSSSAGGNLMLATLLKAQEQNLPMMLPAGEFIVEVQDPEGDPIMNFRIKKERRQ